MESLRATRTMELTELTETTNLMEMRRSRNPMHKRDLVAHSERRRLTKQQ